MPVLRNALAGLRTLFRKREAEREMDEELRAYLDASAGEKMRAGMSREEAFRAARVEMGSAEAVKEQIREAGWERAIDSLWQDIRYGARMLRKSPGFTAVVVLTLALGIGANTAIFSMVDAVLLNPLPYPGASRILIIHESLPQARFLNDSWPDFVDWRDQNKVFAHIAAFQPDSFQIEFGGKRFGEFGARVSSSVFPLLGAKPVLGRTFDDADQKLGAPTVVVLSYGLWRSAMGSNPHVVGRTIKLGREAATIIGVLPRGFRIPDWPFSLFLPIGPISQQPTMTDRGNHPRIVAIAKLRKGVSLEHADVQMNTIMGRLGQEYPQSDKNEKAVLTPLTEYLVGPGRRSELMMLLAATGLLLLLGCANVAHMTLARGLARQREFAVRASVGAGPARLARQLLLEHGLLALCGSAVGVAVAALSVRWLVKMYPEQIFRLSRAQVNGQVLLFALGVYLLVTLLVGIVPAIRAGRISPGAWLKEGGRGTNGKSAGGLRSALLVAEVALALVLTVGAGLMIRSLSMAMGVNPGFRPKHLFELTIWATRAQVAHPEAAIIFFQQCIDRIRALPGVEAVGVAMNPPLSGVEWTSPFGQGAAPPNSSAPWTMIDPVTPGFFRTVGSTLVEGRFFTRADASDSAPVTIVNETLARTISRSGNVVGKQIYIKYAPGPLRRVVGIVADMKQTSLDTPDMPAAYLPASPQVPDYFATVVVRTHGNPRLLEQPTVAAIHQLDKDQPIGEIQTFEAAIRAGLRGRRFSALLLGLFGALALLLAVVGVSGGMAYMVGQRRREIGVRAALGAQSRDILFLVLGRGLLLAGVGTVTGTGAALAASGLLRRQLFEVRPTDPLTLGVAVLVIALAALAACWTPAWRASRVEPMTVLRHE